MNIERIKKKVSADKNDRWHRLTVRRKMYENEWQELLRQEVYRQFLPEIAARLVIQIDTSVNVFEWAVNQLCPIYSRPISRSVEGEELPLMPRLDQGLSLASRWTYGLGECLIRPRYNEENGEWGTWLLPPDSWTAIPDPHDISKVDLLYIEFRNEKNSVNRREVWRDDFFAVLDANWNPIPDESPDNFSNPYGLIPWVVAHSQYPAASFWSDSMSRSLSEAALRLGVAMCDWNNLRHKQAFKQLVLKSGDPKSLRDATRTAGDPGSIILLKGQADDARVIDFQVDLDSHLQTIFKKAQSTLAMKGITFDLIRASQDASSGYALKLKAHGQERIWEQQRSLWDLWEGEYWEKVEILFPNVLPPGKVVRDWPELGPGRDPSEERKHAMEMKSSGLWSTKHAQRKMGMTEEEMEIVNQELLEEAATVLPRIPVL